MEKMVKRPISILNLADEISSELSLYFKKKNIEITNSNNASPDVVWTHIITSNVNDFSEICEKYGVLENNAKILSLTQVNDLQQFVSCNGKLILNEIWMKNSLGAFILDKFFQEYGGISIGDNYPTFQEKGSFNITNPFNTGEYLDRMIYAAFTDGVSALSIKTFFDHLVMYLTGLKTKGKLGLPIEVTYGYFEDVFGVQLHFFTKDLNLDDVTSSLSSVISKKAEKYLLNVAVQSTDFFDFTLLHEVNKTVVTGLWTKDERVKIENRGLLFNELSASAPLTQYPTEGITSYQTENPTLVDFSDKIVLEATPEAPEHVEVISGDTEEDDFLQLITGQKKEREQSQVVKGQKQEKEQAQVIKGRSEEEEAKVFKVSGKKEEKDDFKFMVSSNGAKPSENEVQRIKKLSDTLPDAAKGNLNEFLKNLNKPIEDINEEDLELFKIKEMPKLVNQPEAVQDNGNKTLISENEIMKTKIKTLMAEVKILKDSKAQMAEIQAKAAKAASEASLEIKSITNPDEALRSQLMQKLQEQKALSDQDSKKLAALLERESNNFLLAKEEEIKTKKLQIEISQKDAFFTQEIEKIQRAMKAKDLVVLKTKETFTKLLEKKDQESKELADKLAAEKKIVAVHQSQNQGVQIRELERQIVNHEKMIEIYKNKAIQKPSVKPEDEVLKDENRRLTMLNNQMKNLIEVNKKDISKYQERLAQDTSLLNTLKSDKIKLEGLLKKATVEAKKEESNPVVHQQELEIRRLTGLHENVEAQLKEALNKHKEMEAKLVDALKNQKKEVVTEDATKGKTAHLENNVRKLTQDLVESRNQLAEMKKETNKLRQEKTGLQNQLDKLTKEAEKAKPAAPKKPGSSSTGGKAA